MKILSIETSCDETAVSILKCSGDVSHLSFSVLANELNSQIELHKEYGGVFPTIAKREHAANIIPLFKKALTDAKLLTPKETPIDTEYITNFLSKEPELARQFLEFIPKIENPAFDAIAVTAGPGLEPALWVGINFAKALGHIWNIPVMPINHMEGHILSVLTQTSKPVAFPALALLISGGHTELVFMKDWLTYDVIGETKDDAVGEAFDKVARILGFPYPGGPEISKLAREAREQNIVSPFPLPRPMMHSKDFHFSFSGLKTAVLYAVKKREPLTNEEKKGIAREFEDAVAEVLTKKTQSAIEMYLPKTLILGGGVVANTHIRKAFAMLTKEYGEIELLIPEKDLSTDNSVMIGIAGYLNILHQKAFGTDFRAQGNLRLK